MTPIPLIYSYIPPHYQEIIVEGFAQFDQDINEILNNDKAGYSLHNKEKYVKQWIYLLILTRLYGQNLGIIYSILATDRASILKQYFLAQFEDLSSRSWAYRHIDNLLCDHWTELESLFGKFQDFYFTKIGETARNACKTVYTAKNQDITVPIESFIGLSPPSQIFPEFDTFKRGELMPYFISRIFQEIKHISSTTELDGMLKEVLYMDDQLVYHLAGRLGFINRPPGINKLYWTFAIIEDHLSDYEKIIDKRLIEEEIQDLSVSTVDGSNIPVDRRDSSASNGSGSRGAFYGHKTSISCGTNCIPVVSITESGRTADSSLFSDSIAPIINLTKATSKEIFAICVDAGYSSTPIIAEIEANNAIPFVDINPRGSHLLQKLKEASNDLTELSKKAIKQGLKKKIEKNGSMM